MSAPAFDFDEGHYSNAELERLLNLALPYTADNVQTQLARCAEVVADPTQVAFLERAAARLSTDLGNPSLAPSDAATYFHFNPKELTSAKVVDDQVIVHPTTPFAQNEPSQFFEGTLNPIKKRILFNNLNIDTRFRQNYASTSASDFHLDLPTRLVNVASLQLASMELPAVIYTISASANNNRLTLRRDGAPDFTLVVPDGNYDAASLVLEVNAQLAAQVDYADVTLLINEPATQRATFSSSIPLPFTLDWNDYSGPCTDTYVLSMRLGWMLGFREASYEGVDVVTGEGLVDLRGPQYFYLVVDEFTNSTNDGFIAAFTDSVLNKNVLARIGAKCADSCISQSNFAIVTNPRQYFGPIVIQKLRVQLLDAYGRPVDTNRMDYSFCLTFQTTYNL
jgi:hypothetical protein